MSPIALHCHLVSVLLNIFDSFLHLTSRLYCLHCKQGSMNRRKSGNVAGDWAPMVRWSLAINIKSSSIVTVEVKFSEIISIFEGWVNFSILIQPIDSSIFRIPLNLFRCINFTNRKCLIEIKFLIVLKMVFKMLRFKFFRFLRGKGVLSRNYRLNLRHFENRPCQGVYLWPF